MGDSRPVPKANENAASDKLAREVLELTRDSLLVALRFLDVALCQLAFVPASGALLATDGQNLFYDTGKILAVYKASREKVSRAYLHVVLHCIFHHPFANTAIRPDCWDLACDIAVENIMTEMGLHLTTCSCDIEQKPVISHLRKTIKALTADRIYRHYLDQGVDEDRIAELRKLFYQDDHDGWSIEPDLTEPEDAREQWQAISERIEVDLDTISQQWSARSASLTRNINEVRRERIDYRDFLSRFMVLGESVQVNDEEFDYVFYMHGLNLYKNMPLIEPLEYKEVRKMRDFVIAIDTSGSCSGDLVQAFISKTWAIFQQGENFFQSFNIHLIQCDSEIRSAIKLTRIEDMADYLKTTRLQGFGGTDFRPVFRYVDEMVANKEFTNLKGLIYFTDGLGIFPVHKPAYEAAFVFLSDEGRSLTVPPWAIKLVMSEDDLIAL